MVKTGLDEQAWPRSGSHIHSTNTYFISRMYRPKFSNVSMQQMVDQNAMFSFIQLNIFLVLGLSLLRGNRRLEEVFNML